MFLGMPLVHFLVDNKDYLTDYSQSVICYQAFLKLSFWGYHAGLVNSGIKQAKSQAEKGDQ
ncbi:MAG: hypothetical protein ACLUAO_01810 [Streptococcus sp.]